jgi:integrase
LVLFLGPISLRSAKVVEKQFRAEIKNSLRKESNLGLKWSDLIDQFEKGLANNPSGVSAANITTNHDYLMSLKRHTAHFNHLPVLTIGPNDIYALFNSFDSAGLSHSRKRHIKRAINLLYDWGSRNRLLPPTLTSPASSIPIGKKLKKRQPILTLEQIRKFLDEAKSVNHEFYDLWAVAFSTGMRSGELFALKWSDVCFERKLIRVKRSYNKRQNKFKSTKSGDWREIPINQELEGHLNHLRLKTGATGYVLPRINSWRRGEASKVTRSFCLAINIPEINFHATRACFAVQMLQAKVSVPVVMKIGGWSEFKSFQHYLRLAGVEIQNATDGISLLPIERVGVTLHAIRS